MAVTDECCPLIGLTRLTDHIGPSFTVHVMPIYEPWPERLTGATLDDIMDMFDIWPYRWASIHIWAILFVHTNVNGWWMQWTDITALQWYRPVDTPSSQSHIVTFVTAGRDSWIVYGGPGPGSQHSAWLLWTRRHQELWQSIHWKVSGWG